VRHRPLFVVKMLVEADAYKFSPSLPTLLKTVLGTIDHFIAMLNTVPRVEAELGKGSGARLLTVSTLDDAVVTKAKSRLQSLIETNYDSTERMLRVYTPFAYLLSADTEKKVVDFNNANKLLAEVMSEIDKYLKARREVEKRSLPEVRPFSKQTTHDHS